MDTEKKINIEDEDTLQSEMNDSETQCETPDEATTEEADTDDQEVEVVEGTEPHADLEAEIEELKKQALYKAAEFDNYRKRMQKQLSDAILNGSERAVKEFLPVLDDMERALNAGKQTDDPTVLRDGMELIHNKLWKAFEKLGVTRIETEDVDFDTDLHEAIALVPGMGDEHKGKIIDCTKKGYKLNDKVIRYAQVAVGQ